MSKNNNVNIKEILGESVPIVGIFLLSFIIVTAMSWLFKPLADIQNCRAEAQRETSLKRIGDLNIETKLTTKESNRMFLNAGILIIERPSQTTVREKQIIKIEGREIPIAYSRITITDEDTGSVEYNKTTTKAVSTECLNKLPSREAKKYSKDRYVIENYGIKIQIPREQYMEIFVD